MRILRLFNHIIACSLLLTAAEIRADSPQGAAGKVFVVEATGPGSVLSEGQSVTPTQASVFVGNGAILLTEEKARHAYVLSNGTGLSLDESTRADLSKFEQDRTNWDETLVGVEPSVSKSDIRVAYGTVGVCTPILASGSQMSFTTRDFVIRVPRHARFVVISTPTESRVLLLGGECSVIPAQNPANSGLTLNAGEVGTASDGVGKIVVAPMTDKETTFAEERATIACRARLQVHFSVESSSAGAEADAELVAYPVVPVKLPHNLVVSPDRIY